MTFVTGSKWVGGILQFFNKSTDETINPAGDLVFYDDFLGAGGLAALPPDGTSESSQQWTILEVGSGTVAHEADSPNGAVLFHLAVTGEAEDATLSWNDQMGLSVLNGGILEFRAMLDVIPTISATIVAGLAGPHDLDKDTIANSAWFRWEFSDALLVETDDTTNNNDDTATDVTTVVNVYSIYRIDFTDISDVKFYVDGVNVATDTTFDMSNLSAAESVMQPYFSVDKALSASLGELKLDYVKFWGLRG